MSEVRGMRKTRVGVVVSDKMDKTITIAVKYRVRHPLYGKIMTSSPRAPVSLGRSPASCVSTTS